VGEKCWRRSEHARGIPWRRVISASMTATRQNKATPVHLAVVLDWATRRVLAWRLSITMEAAFCVDTLQDALARHGKPEIFNTDQGSQFAGSAFSALQSETSGLLHAKGCDCMICKIHAIGENTKN
jgi:putative transposase